MGRTDSTGASCALLYPPRVRPPRKPPNLLQLFARSFSNPLLAIPECVYHEPLVVVRGYPAIVWVTEPALAKTVLVDRRDDFPQDPLLRRVLGGLFGNSILTTDGPDWRWQHQTVAPLFRPGEILRYLPEMVSGAETTIKEWRAAPPNAIHPIDNDMVNATYEVISNTLLGGGSSLVGQTLKQGTADYVARIPWSIAFAALNMPCWLPRPGRHRMRSWEFRLRGAVTDMIRERRASTGDQDDLFTRLVSIVNPKTNKTMPEEQLVDNLLTFLLAGHQTVAMTLTWTLYLISRAPEWEARLLEEIRQVVPLSLITVTDGAGRAI